jgi:IS1 family transposase
MQKHLNPYGRLLKGGSIFYVTDGYVVYPQFIEDADHIVNKTYMTRVEGENTRLRHDLARIQ